MMLHLAVHIAELQAKLEGATALNIYLLHKLGGQVTIQDAELQRVCKEFGILSFGMKDHEISLKLNSGTPTPLPPNDPPAVTEVA